MSLVAGREGVYLASFAEFSFLEFDTYRHLLQSFGPQIQLILTEVLFLSERLTILVVIFIPLRSGTRIFRVVADALLQDDYSIVNFGSPISRLRVH